MFEIRFYTPSDYSELRGLYESSGWWDDETDSEERIRHQIQKHPDSILVCVENGKIIGTTTLLFTERLGLFFRLIANKVEVRRELLKRGEEIFKEKGYKETHVIAQEENVNQHKVLEEYGFNKGRLFRWFWKKID